MKALVAHPGTQYAGKLAFQLHRLGRLSGLHTGFALSEGSLADRAIAALPFRWSRRASNRRIRIPGALLHLHPLEEGLALVRQRLGAPQQEVFHARNERFQKRIPDSAFRDADAVIGFDTSSWILARRASRNAIPFILDQSIGHAGSKARVYAHLRQTYPEWSHDAEERLPRVREVEAEEHDRARLIVVPSTFAKETLVENGIAAAKIRINPFGVDSSRFSPNPRSPNVPIRFVFVGSITVRKGIPQLLAAWRRLKAPRAELWLVGRASPSAQNLIGGHENVVYKGSLPNRELPALLQQCDVFVFPTFFEGFAQVIPEAMACGLPVLATTSAGADIIRSGENGWLIAPGDDEALSKGLEHCIRARESVLEAGVRARASAVQLSWERYGEQWAEILDEARSARA